MNDTLEDVAAAVWIEICCCISRRCKAGKMKISTAYIMRVYYPLPQERSKMEFMLIR